MERNIIMRIDGELFDTDDVDLAAGDTLVLHLPTLQKRKVQIRVAVILKDGLPCFVFDYPTIIEPPDVSAAKE